MIGKSADTAKIHQSCCGSSTCNHVSLNYAATHHLSRSLLLIDWLRLAFGRGPIRFRTYAHSILLLLFRSESKRWLLHPSYGRMIFKSTTDIYKTEVSIHAKKSEGDSILTRYVHRPTSSNGSACVCSNVQVSRPLECVEYPQPNGVSTPCREHRRRLNEPTTH